MITARIRGIAMAKYHQMLGKDLSPPWKVATFMPKKPLRKVRGRKMNVIQDSRHMDVPSWSECRESRISTLLYILVVLMGGLGVGPEILTRSVKLVVGLSRSSSMSDSTRLNWDSDSEKNLRSSSIASSRRYSFKLPMADS